MRALIITTIIPQFPISEWETVHVWVYLIRYSASIIPISISIIFHGNSHPGKRIPRHQTIDQIILIILLVRVGSIFHFRNTNIKVALIPTIKTYIIAHTHTLTHIHILCLYAYYIYIYAYDIFIFMWIFHHIFNHAY